MVKGKADLAKIAIDHQLEVVQKANLLGDVGGIFDHLHGLPIQVATCETVADTLREIEAFTADKTTILSMPRIFQAIGYRR